VKSSGYATTLLLVVGASLYSGLPCTAGPARDCSTIVTNAEIAKNGWISFHHGKVISIDLARKLLAVEIDGEKYGIYFTDSTEFCNRGKAGALRDIKTGDRIGGFTKLVQGKSVADIIGVGEVPNPFGIPVPGKEGWVRSPYAPSQPPIDVSKLPSDAVVQCPYTGKPFRIPASPKS
jgi:hypothetical protein